MLNKKSKIGFTMVEVLIAVFVVTVGVIGSYIVLQRIFAYTFISSSRLTAAYLAKEGFEIVRNIRDSNWIAGDGWDKNLVKNNPPGFNGCELSGVPFRFCEADYGDMTLVSIGGTSDPNFLELNGVYAYGVGADTRFFRKIEIYPMAANSLRVVVTINWQEQSQDNSLVVEGFLYDWR